MPLLLHLFALKWYIVNCVWVNVTLYSCWRTLQEGQLYLLRQFCAIVDQKGKRSAKDKHIKVSFARKLKMEDKGTRVFCE